MPDPKYDLGISFLSRDEPIARDLYDRLSGSLTVFFFPRNQEELSGTDGMESMRLAFRERSRLNVVLYREGWGGTPWTRVEETAIKDRCLNDGFKSLFFIVLDDARHFPLWLPDTHIRFHLTDYDINQAAGAIKLRVQELGGRFTPQDATARAKSIQRKISHEEDKARLFSDQRWIMETLLPSVASVLADAVQQVNRIATENRWAIRTGADNRKCVITNGPVSVLASWWQEFSNKPGNLLVVEYNGRVLLPGERDVTTLAPPNELRRCSFVPELSGSRELCWVEESNARRHYSHADLADRIVQKFLDLFERAQRGEFPSEMDRFLKTKGR